MTTRKLFYLLSISLLLSFQSVFADRGQGSSGGGDNVAPLFRAMCITLARSIQLLPQSNIPSVTYDINWRSFEQKCAEVPLIVLKEYTRPKDQYDIPRDFLFITRSQNQEVGGIMFSEPIFLEAIEHNLIGLLTNIMHEIFRAQGLTQEEEGHHQISSQVLIDYNTAFVKTIDEVENKISILLKKKKENPKIFNNSKKLDIEYAKSFIQDSIDQVAIELGGTIERGRSLVLQIDNINYEEWKERKRQFDGQKAFITSYMGSMVQAMKKSGLGIGITPRNSAPLAQAFHSGISNSFQHLDVAYMPKVSEKEWFENQLELTTRELYELHAELMIYKKKRKEFNINILDHLIDNIIN